MYLIFSHISMFFPCTNNGNHFPVSHDVTSDVQHTDKNSPTVTTILETFLSFKMVVIQFVIKANSVAQASKNGKDSLAVFLT